MLQHGLAAHEIGGPGQVRGQRGQGVIFFFEQGQLAPKPLRHWAQALFIGPYIHQVGAAVGYTGGFG